jgi:hypothetical protein
MEVRRLLGNLGVSNDGPQRFDVPTLGKVLAREH